LVEEVGEDWVAVFNEAQSNDGYLLDFLPIRKKGRVDIATVLPENADNRLVNCRTVIEALQHQGRLSAEEYANALEEIGSEGQVIPSATIPRKGSELHCRGILPELLADANLLPLACEQFSMYVERSEIDRIRAELWEHEQRQAAARWLESLIDRIRKGIDQRTYEIIPYSSRGDEQAEEESHKSPDARCLETLMRFEPGADDAVWADDRFLNSFFFRGKAPIIGVNEIMKALVCRGPLSVGEYYQCMHKLRAGNVRFIPLEKGEILHHLLQAKIDKNEVIETRELAVLRRYVASCLLQGDMLQRPPMPEGSPNHHGEIAFIIGLARATIDSLAAMWADKGHDESECIVRSEWVLDNLYLDYLGLLAVTKMGAAELDPRHRVAMGLTALIISAFGLDTHSSGDQPSRRRIYLQWLSDRVIHKRFAADPSLAAATADVIKRHFTGPDEQPQEPNEQLDEPNISIRAAVLRDIFNDLPKPIQEELIRDVDFMSTVGFKSTRIITIEDLKFDGDEFFRAAAAAINGRAATITPLGGGATIAFESIVGSSQQTAFRFHHPVTGKAIQIGNDELELLVDSPAKRETFLRRNRHWFDCPPKVFDEAVATIATIGDPRHRIEELEPWRKSSASEFYARLHDRIASGDPMKFSDLVPSIGEGLLRHYRLTSRIESSSDFTKLLDSSAQALIKEEGLEAAITRLAGFPVPLPSPVITAIRLLSLQERRTLIKQLLAVPGSPLSWIHLLYVLVLCGDETPAFRRLVGRICTRLFHVKGKRTLEAFLALLKWTNDEFALWNETHVWSHPVRLAMVWAHTHRLFSTLVSGGIPSGRIKHIVSKADQRIPVQIFRRELEYRLDIANPRHVNRIRFLLAGLSYALGERAEHFLSGDSRKALAREAFPTPETEGIRLPNLQLLMDSSQARDGLGSFLGGDQGDKLLPLLGKDALCLSRASLKSVVEMAIDKLTKKEGESVPWIQLSAVLSDLPPYEGVVDRLNNGIKQTDFVDIFQKDIRVGTYAFSVASLQASNIRDDKLCRHLQGQLLRIAKLLADRHLDKSHSNAALLGTALHRKACSILLDAALNISVASRSDETAVREFVEIVTQMVNTWPEIVPVIAPIVQRLWEELPPAYAQPLAILHVLCRSK